MRFVLKSAARKTKWLPLQKPIEDLDNVKLEQRLRSKKLQVRSYNASAITLTTALDDPNHIRANVEAYVGGDDKKVGCAPHIRDSTGLLYSVDESLFGEAIYRAYLLYRCGVVAAFLRRMRWELGKSHWPAGGRAFVGATSSVCVTASNKAQTVSVPPAAGVGVTLALAEYDAGDAGCQDATVETGADVGVSTNSKFVYATASTRTVANATIASSSTAPAPIMSISLGAAEPQNTSSLLSFTTIVSGVTIATGNNVFPDGTYLATCTYFILGEKVENSIVFTAKKAP
jgi:hypothetical protein